MLHWKFPAPAQLIMLLLLFSAGIVKAQSEVDLIQKGKKHLKEEQLDSASLYYELAYQSLDANIQLQAVGGLISIAILKSEVSMADSLVSVGDQLIENQEISLINICEFRIKKGEFYRKNSQYQTALSQHQETVKLSQKLENGELIYADALFYTGLTFERLSSYDSSIAYLNKAYAIFQENLDTTAIKFAGIYNGMANTYYRLNQFEKAKEFYLKSKHIAETQIGPVSSDLAIALGNLSSISRAEENYPQAIAYSEQALKIHRALKDDSGIASDYYALGVYRYFIGDYGRTKDYMEACIAMREKIYNPVHASLIGPYEVLGIAYEESGDYEKTLYYLKKAKPIIEANFGSNSMVGAFNYENTAICYKNIGTLDSALHYIGLANQIQTTINSGNNYSLGVHYFNYANILYLLDQFDQTRIMAGKSERIYQNLNMNETSEYAQIQSLYGSMAAEEGNWDVADDQFEKALNIVRMPGEQREPEFAFQLTPNALALVNEYSKYFFQKYQKTKDPSALKSFEDYSQVYLDLSDKFRKQFIDSYTKSILIKDNAEVYNRNVGIYYQLFQESGDQAYLNAAYNFSEYGRASLLRDLQDDKIKSYAGVPDTVLEKERQLKKQIANLNQQLLDKPDSEEVKKNLFSSKEELNAFIQSMLDAYPAYHDLKFNTSIPTLEEIKTQLAEGENLIEYMQDDSAYYAMIIHASSTTFLHLGKKDSINYWIKDWKEKMILQDVAGVQQAGLALYQKLWWPMEAHLKGSRITIVPCGPLFYLNFETLPFAPASFLIEQYNISYGLSFHVLFSKNYEKNGQSIIAVAPGFEEEIKKQYQNKLDTLEIPDQEFLRTVRQPWSLKLVSYLKKKFAPLAFTGIQATESNVKANIQEGKLLYFGTHAIADASDPLRSKLLLAKEIGEQKEDGYLHAYEFFGLPLEAELAVLNACESGLGNLQEGEGMISLAYSLHYAGCPSTVMSLWKVDEKISTRITQNFLDYLNEGLPKSQALRQAKLDYLQTADPLLQDPFYWGGMVLMGKDGGVELRKTSSPWLFLLMGIGLASILFLLWKRFA